MNVIQIITLQRSGGSALHMSIAKTYDLKWNHFNYEPITGVKKLYQINDITKKTIDNLKDTSPQDIENITDRIRLIPRKNINDNDADLVLSYLKELFFSGGMVQKTLGLVTLFDDFIKIGMHPVFCNRYLDQYLSSHIRLGIAPENIFKKYPGVLSKNHDEPLQEVINILREKPIFSYNMGKIDQFPACCRWLIHSYYSICISQDKDIPIVWTGDNKTKSDYLCEYIRQHLGPETGVNGYLHDNLIKKVVPNGAEFIYELENHPGQWKFWPDNKTNDVESSKKFTNLLYNILSKTNNSVMNELSQRIYCQEEKNV